MNMKILSFFVAICLINTLRYVSCEEDNDFAEFEEFDEDETFEQVSTQG